MKKIYILLAKTRTLPSRMIHFIKGVEFTHASLATEPRTDRFFSYARRKLNNTLVAGFVIEDIHKGVFSRYPNCNCRLYSLNVEDEAYENIEKQLTFFMENYEKATYNFSALFTMLFGKSAKRPLKHTCAQFVATLLENSNAAKLPKSPQSILPSDFINIENIELLYEGPLARCVIPDTVNYKII